MFVPIRKLEKENWPKQLLEIPDPPKELWVRGEIPKEEEEMIYLTIVGSRKFTPYGRDACESLIRGLSGHNICIISGLAMGIDTIAHKAALKFGLKTMAFFGSGLDPHVMYPKENMMLAEDIVAAGGALVSEYEPMFKAQLWSFPARNRLAAGMSKAVLIIEAEEKSGTLITARLAMDYNRDVLAVPGSIFSPNSDGTNRLIREGATPIRNSKDLLQALGFKTETDEELLLKTKENPNQPTLLLILPESEQKVYNALRYPMSRDELADLLEIPMHILNIELTKLELKEIIREELGKLYRIR